jgi:type IV secretory pathway VirB3-like protein
MLGVPLLFCVLNVLVGMGIALFWLPWVFVAAGLHGLGRLGTAYDLQWIEVLVQHVSYRSYYKG